MKAILVLRELEVAEEVNMPNMVSFTDSNTNETVHVVADRLIGFTRWYSLGAKPEDKPVGTLVFVDGIPKGLLVSESYGRVLATFRECGLIFE
jgi:hypothetical protein